MSPSMDLPKRGDIKRRIDDDQKHMDNWEQKLEEDAEDIEISRDTQAKLELDTTEEGAMGVLENLDDAQNKGLESFDEDEKQLTDVHLESKEHGETLDTRERSGESDIKHLETKERRLHLNETMEHFTKALEGLSEDVAFLRDEAERNRELREQSDNRAKILRSRIEQGG